MKCMSIKCLPMESLSMTGSIWNVWVCMYCLVGTQYRILYSDFSTLDACRIFQGIDDPQHSYIPSHRFFSNETTYSRMLWLFWGRKYKNPSFFFSISPYLLHFVLFSSIQHPYLYYPSPRGRRGGGCIM